MYPNLRPNQWFQSWPPEIMSIADGPYWQQIRTVNVGHVFVNYEHKYIHFFIIMVTLLWKLIPPCSDNSCNLTKLKSIIHIYIYAYLFLEINKRNTNHARETSPTFNCWRFSWSSQHFKENSSPLVGLEPTTFRLYADYTYVYTCTCRYIFVGRVTSLHTFLCWYTYTIGQTCKADPKKYDLVRSNICHKQTPKWMGSVDFTACLPIFFFFFDSAYIKTPLYQIWCFPPKVKIPATFCHISARLSCGFLK